MSKKYFCSCCGSFLSGLSDLSIIDTTFRSTRYSSRDVTLFLCPVCFLKFIDLYKFHRSNIGGIYG